MIYVGLSMEYWMTKWHRHGQTIPGNVPKDFTWVAHKRHSASGAVIACSRYMITGRSTLYGHEGIYSGTSLRSNYYTFDMQLVGATTGYVFDVCVLCFPPYTYLVGTYREKRGGPAKHHRGAGRPLPRISVSLRLVFRHSCPDLCYTVTFTVRVLRLFSRNGRYISKSPSLLGEMCVSTDRRSVHRPAKATTLRVVQCYAK